MESRAMRRSSAFGITSEQMSEKPKPLSAKQTARKILFDLREWARIEQSFDDLKPGAEETWKAVEGWADGAAVKMGISLRPTFEEQMERQNRAFPGVIPHE